MTSDREAIRAEIARRRARQERRPAAASEFERLLSANAEAAGDAPLVAGDVVELTVEIAGYEVGTRGTVLSRRKDGYALVLNDRHGRPSGRLVAPFEAIQVVWRFGTALKRLR